MHLYIISSINTWVENMVSIDTLLNAEFWSKIAEFLSAILTPIIAVIVTYIAIRQWKTDHDRLRLDLYDKRFKVYQSIMDILSIISQNGDISLEEISQFTIKTNESKFLFENEIPDFIENIIENSIKLHFLEAKIKQNANTDIAKIKEKVEESSGLVNWFYDQFKTSNNLFLKYLSFKKI